MAATHHSQLNDAIFFPSFPASFPWERLEGGVSASIQSKGGQTEFISFRWDEETSRRTRRDEGDSSEPVRSGPVPERSCSDATAGQDG